jgi:hypothetical protein
MSLLTGVLPTVVDGVVASGNVAVVVMVAQVSAIRKDLVPFW